MKLTKVPRSRADFSNKEKIIKIGRFFQKLSWNKGMACTKIREKSRYKFKKKTKTNKKFKNSNLRCTHPGVLESLYEI